jgi:hypothetical protein
LLKPSAFGSRQNYFDVDVRRASRKRTFINAVAAAIILGFLKHFAHINASGALTGVTLVRNKPAPFGALIWRNRLITTR